MTFSDSLLVKETGRSSIRSIMPPAIRTFGCPLVVYKETPRGNVLILDNKINLFSLTSWVYPQNVKHHQNLAIAVSRKFSSDIIIKLLRLKPRE